MEIYPNGQGSKAVCSASPYLAVWKVTKNRKLTNLKEKPKKT